MKNTEALIEAITAEKILPLFRKQPLETVLKVTEYLEEAGFHHVEITMESENVSATYCGNETTVSECPGGSGNGQNSGGRQTRNRCRRCFYCDT